MNVCIWTWDILVFQDPNGMRNMYITLWKQIAMPIVALIIEKFVPSVLVDAILYKIGTVSVVKHSSYINIVNNIYQVKVRLTENM